MGLLDKLMGRSETAQPEQPTETVTCPHLVLVPRWDSVDDIGHEERATSFHCEGCGEDFSAAEMHALRESQGDRLRDTVPPEARDT